MNEVVRHFCDAYLANARSERKEEILNTFLKFVEREDKNPTPFDLFHSRVKEPFDYAAFGLEFISPLIDWEQSIVKGLENLDAIDRAIKKGENVILLANHQVEPDPQVIHLMLQKRYPELAEKIIFVAGDRVVRDPLAIPLSLGCNLLCIYSKKYIDTPPSMRASKLLHNKKTMAEMERLLKEGGQLIYVAPSGGRDRKDEKGELLPALFDPASVEMLYLISRQAKRTTHFHTLALHTYDLLPPPATINLELGEERLPAYAPVALHFGPAFDMDCFSEIEDKKLRRTKRAEKLYDRVCYDYHNLWE